MSGSNSEVDANDGSLTLDATAVVTDRPDPMIGRTLGDSYRILGKLGEGGMGAVYLAEQLSVGRKVALKVLHRQYAREQQFVERFQREARLTASLNHPGITTIFDFMRTDDETLVIVMEYLQGMPLSDVLRKEGALPLSRALRLGIQIGDALAAAHSAQVIHRDVKPANIYVLVANDAVKLLDFGIARLRDARDTGVTQAGMMVGTPNYMAPEQIQGRDITDRTDIYAFGIVLFEMLTGRPPFTAPTIDGVLTKQLSEVPRSPTALKPDIPAPVEQVILHALQKDPQSRPSSMSQVVERLRAADAETTVAIPRQAARRKPWVVGAITGVIVSFIAIAAFVGPSVYTTVHRWIQPPAEPVRIQRTVETELRKRGLLRRTGTEGQGVTVRVGNGVVTLTGMLPDKDRRDAIEAAAAVPGVRQVESHIDPPPPDAGAIQTAVSDRLQAMGVPSPPDSRGYGVTVRVDAGTVILTGVLADKKLIDGVVDAIRGVPGVRGVQPDITVREPGPVSIQAAVEEKLRGIGLLRSPGSDQPGGVTVVEVKSGRVKLKGVLVDEQQRQQVIEAVRGVKGVLAVDSSATQVAW